MSIFYYFFSENREIKPISVVSDLVATTANISCRASNRNVEDKMNEVQTVSQCVNEKETISDPPMGTQVDNDSNAGKRVNLRGNARKIVFSDERQRLEMEPRRKWRVANAHEHSLSVLKRKISLA